MPATTTARDEDRATGRGPGWRPPAASRRAASDETVRRDTTEVLRILVGVLLTWAVMLAPLVVGL